MKIQELVPEAIMENEKYEFKPNLIKKIRLAGLKP